MLSWKMNQQIRIQYSIALWCNTIIAALRHIILRVISKVNIAFITSESHFLLFLLQHFHLCQAENPAIYGSSHETDWMETP